MPSRPEPYRKSLGAKTFDRWAPRMLVGAALIIALDQVLTWFGL